MERGVRCNCEMQVVQHEEAKGRQHLGAVRVLRLVEFGVSDGRDGSGSSFRHVEFDNLRSLSEEVPRMEKNHPLFGAIKSLPTRILRENVQQVLVQLGW